MSPFRPAEIRVILFLSVLIFVGALLTLLERQRIIAEIDLGVFAENRRFNYTYRSSDLADSSLRLEENAGEEVASPGGRRQESNPGPAESPRIIDINIAGLYDLQSLPGIGPVMAQRIIAYRDSVGRFESVEDLMNVKGIGRAKLELLKGRIAVQ